jgi:hypothetical protein
MLGACFVPGILAGVRQESAGLREEWDQHAVGHGQRQRPS